jgi:DNA-directed RNA polymerase specialized sigma24 family protein
VRQDETGFAEFYRASHQRRLRAVIAGAGRPDLAEDLVAEAFTRALVSWRTVRDHPAPEAWVVRTALNAGTSWWRRHRREVPLGDHDAVAPQRWEPGESGGELGPSPVAGRVGAVHREPPARAADGGHSAGALPGLRVGRGRARAGQRQGRRRSGQRDACWPDRAV